MANIQVPNMEYHTVYEKATNQEPPTALSKHRLQEAIIGKSCKQAKQTMETGGGEIGLDSQAIREAPAELSAPTEIQTHKQVSLSVVSPAYHQVIENQIVHLIIRINIGYGMGFAGCADAALRSLYLSPKLAH
ncbi:hypothetical protein V492_06912 [Pseudogymnoascus sp. VKM F-4246]|nr:hypothetical protein V492_06912 [Pseudogymnoascus sp. VKM F-4246]